MAEFDYIVVGAGSAGCVVAARLSEDPSLSVALVEAGGSDNHPYIAMPLTWMKLLDMEAVNWGTKSEAEPHMDGRVQPLPRGKVLGGCSTTNGTMYIRGMAADYDGWRDAGLEGWGFDDVLPYFRRSEANWRGMTNFHGGEGPLSVTPLEKHAELYPAFLKAGEALGYSEAEDFNVPAPEGFGLPDCTIKRGRRHSTKSAFLDPAIGRRNLEVVPHALVQRIVIENGRAIGIEIVRDGQRQTIHARREVVVCGGAFNSPQLLMLSGIGSAGHLREHGIEVVADLPGVGANLQDHAIAQSFWAAARPNTLDRELRLDRLVWNGVKWMLTGKGTPAQSPLTIQGFIRSDEEQERPDLQFQASHVSYEARPWFPFWRKGAGHQISAGVLHLAPASRGRVSLASADAGTVPKVLLNFMAEEVDRHALRNAIRITRKFMATDAARPWVAAELAPGPQAESDEAIDAWLRGTVISGAHPTSTCAMGTGPDAVLDHRLRVRGVDGLRVADCSVMPTIVRGNTNAPAIMIGEKAADMIREAGQGKEASQ